MDIRRLTAMLLLLGCPKQVPTNTAVQGPPFLVVSLAHFDVSGGAPRPQPGMFRILTQTSDGWEQEDVLDEMTNVLHDAVPWRGGILTIGANKAPDPASLTHWTRGADGTWMPRRLWTPAWEGARFNRLRDIEVADLDGDDVEELVIATHDRGVVAVLRASGDGWTAEELDGEPDTFVHEVEVGDLDGDGQLEIYASASPRRDHRGYPWGRVRRYERAGKRWVHEDVQLHEGNIIKEITIADLDEDGIDELYVSRDGAGRAAPDDAHEAVIIDRVTATGPDRTSVEFARFDNQICRFVVPGDPDHDGALELVVGCFPSGLWMLESDGSKTLIDASSGGFEHVVHVADLDDDGRDEVYVTSDDEGELRRYLWNGETWERERVGAIQKGREISWSIRSGRW